MLFSQTGVTAAIERSQLGGTLLAIDEINAGGGVLGRPVEAVIHDPASNPKSYGQLTERLLTERQGTADLRLLHVEHPQGGAAGGGIAARAAVLPDPL